MYEKQRLQGEKHALLGVYLINLDRAEGRRLRMTEKLVREGLSFERISAVDGAVLKLPIPEFSALGYGVLHGRRPYAPEIGCYLSHVEAAQTFLASDFEFALILEDDVDFPEDFADILSAAIANCDDWDLLRLSTVNSGPKLPFKKLTQSRSLAIALAREKGAGAYLINRRAAGWITSKLLPMRLAWDIAFDLEYLSGLKAAFVTPVPVTQSSEQVSQIQEGVKGSKLGRWRYLTVFPYRAYLEITRLLFRGARLLYLRLKNAIGR